MYDATAELTTPLVVALAVAGLGLAFPWTGRRVDAWAVVSAIGAYGVYSLPILLTGTATFAGYLTLDDTATWLALADHVMEHGRTVSSLAPSTYQQVLADYLATSGYPVGTFTILGVGSELTGQDVAWLFQPTIAFFAAMLALAIYAATADLIESRGVSCGGCAARLPAGAALRLRVLERRPRSSLRQRWSLSSVLSSPRRAGTGGASAVWYRWRSRSPRSLRS